MFGKKIIQTFSSLCLQEREERDYKIYWDIKEYHKENSL